MSKIYILKTGEKLKAFESLRVLAKEIGVEPRGLKEKLPFVKGSFAILEIELNTKF